MSSMLPNSIVLNLNGKIINFISGIKAVRGLTGYGLKESKDLMDDLKENGTMQIIDVQPDLTSDRYVESMRLLKSSGVAIQLIHNNNPARDAIAEQIRAVVTFSTMSAQYDIAKTLIDVLDTYCPKPSKELKKEEENDNGNGS